MNRAARARGMAATKPLVIESLWTWAVRPRPDKRARGGHNAPLALRRQEVVQEIWCFTPISGSVRPRGTSDCLRHSASRPQPERSGQALIDHHQATGPDLIGIGSRFLLHSCTSWLGRYQEGSNVRPSQVVQSSGKGISYLDCGNHYGDGSLTSYLMSYLDM